MARPRAGDWPEDEIAHWRRSGVGLVVSLLERDEIDDLGLKMEAIRCEEIGFEQSFSDLLLLSFGTISNRIASRQM